MAAQHELFIDIDREPERSRTRPVGVPVSPPASSPLWPAALPLSERRDPREIGISPLGAVPVVPPDTPPEIAIDYLAAEAHVSTRPLAADLATSLAALRPGPSITRPVSLADALAPMAPAPNIQAAAQQTAAYPQPDLEEPPGWQTSNGMCQGSVPAQEPALFVIDGSHHEGDDYLTRSYDFASPAVANLYERAVVPLWSAPFGRMLLSAFQAHTIQPGWQVVDVACGTGFPTLEAARLLGNDGDVAGIDIWNAGIARARARAEALRLRNASFLVADVAGCDLPEHSFDLALCNLGLTNFAQPEAALTGIARLLQPDGTLILTTNLHGTMQEFFEIYRGVLNDLGLHDLSWDVERVMHLQPTQERVEALLDMAGFTVEQTISDYFTLEFPDGSTFLRSPLVGLGFLHTWRQVIGDLALRRVIFHEIERRLNARATAWGRLDLTIPMLCITARQRSGE